jgi:hypothetical protein
MSKSYEAQGIIHSIGETMEFGNNGFTKREFVIQLTGPDENSQYPNYIALELIKDKCVLMDNYKIGAEIQVSFNISGRLWASAGKPEKCFTSLQAWKVSAASDNQETPPSRFADEPPADYDSIPIDDDIPF